MLQRAGQDLLSLSSLQPPRQQLESGRKCEPGREREREREQTVRTWGVPPLNGRGSWCHRPGGTGVGGWEEEGAI